LVWAKNHKDWTQNQWKNVIWSDESTFTLSSSVVRRVWRRSGERFKPEGMVGTIKKHEKKINVWGCFSANGVGNLYRINGILTGEAYKQILIDQMMPSSQKLFTTNN
jgi:hypothetical protein